MLRKLLNAKLVLMVVVVAFVAVGGWRLTHRPKLTDEDKAKNVATVFFKDLYSHDDHTKDAYKLASAELKQAYNQDVFTAKFADSGFIFQSMNFVETVTDGSGMGFHGVITADKGAVTNYFNMKLVKSSSDWKVYSFEVL